VVQRSESRAAGLTAPFLTLTGPCLPPLSPAQGTAQTRWAFSIPELATAYADWLKARAEVPFTEKQLAKVRELSAARVKSQTKVVERLRKLVAAGTEAEKDQAAAETELLQAQLTGQKEVFEAETAVKNAVRTRGTLERQLFQAGIDPYLLGTGQEGAGRDTL